MRKILLSLMLAGFVLAAVGSSAQAVEGRGGFMGFIAGCCFGIRAGADYNSGKDIHWREWVMLIPYANFVFAVWNGIDGANGVTRAEYAAKYGSQYY